MKNTFILFLSVYVILYPGCKDVCDEGSDPTINKVWTFTEGSEVNSNGYYLDYPDGLVTTSTNTINYMPGDDGWFDGLTIFFMYDENNLFTNENDCGETDIHDFDGLFRRIYDFGGVYDTIIANYVIPINNIDEYNDQPNILITGDGDPYDLKVVSLSNETNDGPGILELFKSQMDTFTYWGDPLNDTVYWSSYDETRKYSNGSE